MYLYSLESAKLLFKTAGEMGLDPKWLNNYGLFAITVNKKTHYIFHGISNLNTQLSAQLSRHKHLTRIVLEQIGLPNIPFIRPRNNGEINEFINKHKLIIAKPVLGGGSRDIHMINSIREANNLDIEDYIFEKFIKGKEMRLLFFKGRIIAVHEKSYKGQVNDPKIVKRISYPEKDWDKQQVMLAIKSAEALSLQFATVDFIINEQNKPYILEVNSAPGLYFFQYPTSGPSIDIARIFLEETIKQIKQEK